MNPSAQLKVDLINRIRKINDLNFLQSIQDLLASSEPDLFKLSDLQKQTIDVSRNQIKTGKYKNSQTILSEIKQWLKQK